MESLKASLKASWAELCFKLAMDAPFTLDPRALCERYNALAEEVGEERESLTRRLGALQAMNAEAHEHRFRALEQASELSKMNRAKADLEEEMSSGKLSVASLLETIERKDGELAAQDARIQTLLAFVPERDVAMVFDGAATGPRTVDLGDDLDAVAAGAKSPRHCDRPAIVARFPRRSAGGGAAFGGLDLRRHGAADRGEEPRPPLGRGPAPTRRGEGARRADAPPPPPGGGEPRRGARAAADDDDGARRAAAARHASQVDAFRAREAALIRELQRRDDLLHAATRDVVEAKREALDARVRLGRGEAELAAAHARVSDACVALRARYEAEARAARAALAREVEAATVVETRARGAAEGRADAAEAALRSQTSTHSGALRKARGDVAYLKKTARDLQRRRKLELEGYGRDVSELRRRLDAVHRSGALKSRENVARVREDREKAASTYDPAKFA